jgi:hypothetical protein
MTTTLTNEEKLGMIDQHKRNLDFSIYGFELDLIELNAITPLDAEAIDSVTSRLALLNNKKAALVAEAAKLTE